MQAVRHLLAHRRLAVLICAATLVLKLLIPTGYMIDDDRGHLALIICTGLASSTTDMPGMHDGMADHGGSKDHGKSEDHGKAEMPCAFSGLSAASLAAVDPIQLAALIAFVLSVGLASLALPPPSRRAHLRPPLRGPPDTP